MLIGGFSSLAQQPLSVSKLPGEAPLSITATATTARLTVELTIAPDWHLYARDTGGGQPVTLTVDELSSFRAAGALQVPHSDDGRITGQARLVLPLRRHASGKTLTVTMEFMACDPLMCLPPMECVLSGELDEAGEHDQLDVLLVVRRLDERSERIAAFLRGHGHACTATTYADVQAAMCDRHDVVLADSELFEAARAATKTVWEFPRTTSPVVAVGFLGTELIEKHGLAMTSGYI